jgi:hypothetical protein
MSKRATRGWALLALLVFAALPASALAAETGNDNSFAHARTIAISNEVVAPAVQVHSFSPKTATRAADYVDYVKFTANHGSTYQVQVYGGVANVSNKFRVTLYYYSNHLWHVVHGRYNVPIAGAFTNYLNKFKADETRSSKITYAVKIVPYNTKRLPGNYYVAVTRGSSSVKPDSYDATDGVLAGATPISPLGFDSHRLFLDDVYTFNFLNRLPLHSTNATDADFYRADVPPNTSYQLGIFMGLYRYHAVTLTTYDADGNVIDDSGPLEGYWAYTFTPSEATPATYYYAVRGVSSFWYRVGLLYDSSSPQ